MIRLPKKNEKNFWSKGVIKNDREKIKNAWIIGNYKFVVIHSNGSIFVSFLGVGGNWSRKGEHKIS